jgi:Domain of unknown function (DUF397)
MSNHETPSAWRKSTFSQGGDCVEWRFADSSIFMRTSKDPSGPVLKFSYSEWRAFIAGVKDGQADLDSAD